MTCIVIGAKTSIYSVTLYQQTKNYPGPTEHYFSVLMGSNQRYLTMKALDCNLYIFGLPETKFQTSKTSIIWSETGTAP